MKSPLLLIAAVLHAFTSLSAEPKPELLEVRKIWDAGAHNAFTDLIRFQGKWLCSFREGEDHVGGDGKLRIIESPDGITWSSSALIAEDGIDLRDPKMSVTPDNRLMVVAGGSVYRGTKTLQSRAPRVAFSPDGRTWSAPERVLGEGDWLWRVTWNQGRAYGVAYNHWPTKGPNKPESEWALKLYESTNGKDWTLVTPLSVTGKPNETTLRFLKNGDAMMLVRREGGDHQGWIGVSSAPYRDWKFQATQYRLGGPNFIELPNGSLIAGSRDGSSGAKKCSLFRMTRESLTPILSLPSSGDCSYPGLAWHDGLLWISYYSSHAGKTSIYLAKVKLPASK